MIRAQIAGVSLCVFSILLTTSFVSALTCTPDKPKQNCSVNGAITEVCGQCPQQQETVTPGSTDKPAPTTNATQTGNKTECDKVQLNSLTGGVITCWKEGVIGGKTNNPDGSPVSCTAKQPTCASLRRQAVDAMKGGSAAGEQGLPGSPSGPAQMSEAREIVSGIDKAYEDTMGKAFDPALLDPNINNTAGDFTPQVKDSIVGRAQQSLSRMAEYFGGSQVPDDLASDGLFQQLNKSWGELTKPLDLSFRPTDFAGPGTSDWMARAGANIANDSFGSVNPDTPYYTGSGQTTFGAARDAGIIPEVSSEPSAGFGSAIGGALSNAAETISTAVPAMWQSAKETAQAAWDKVLSAVTPSDTATSELVPTEFPEAPFGNIPAPSSEGIISSLNPDTSGAGGDAGLPSLIDPEQFANATPEQIETSRIELLKSLTSDATSKYGLDQFDQEGQKGALRAITGDIADNINAGKKYDPETLRAAQLGAELALDTRTTFQSVGDWVGIYSPQQQALNTITTALNQSAKEQGIAYLANNAANIDPRDLTSIDTVNPINASEFGRESGVSPINQAEFGRGASVSEPLNTTANIDPRYSDPDYRTPAILDSIGQEPRGVAEDQLRTAAANIQTATAERNRQLEEAGYIVGNKALPQGGISGKTTFNPELETKVAAANQKAQEVLMRAAAVNQAQADAVREQGRLETIMKREGLVFEKVPRENTSSNGAISSTNEGVRIVSPEQQKREAEIKSLFAKAEAKNGKLSNNELRRLDTLLDEHQVKDIDMQNALSPALDARRRAYDALETAGKDFTVSRGQLGSTISEIDGIQDRTQSLLVPAEAKLQNAFDAYAMRLEDYNARITDPVRIGQDFAYSIQAQNDFAERAIASAQADIRSLDSVIDGKYSAYNPQRLLELTPEQLQRNQLESRIANAQKEISERNDIQYAAERSPYRDQIMKTLLDTPTTPEGQLMQAQLRQNLLALSSDRDPILSMFNYSPDDTNRLLGEYSGAIPLSPDTQSYIDNATGKGSWAFKTFNGTSEFLHFVGQNLSTDTLTGINNPVLGMVTGFPAFMYDSAANGLFGVKTLAIQEASLGRTGWQNDFGRTFDQAMTILPFSNRNISRTLPADLAPIIQARMAYVDDTVASIARVNEQLATRGSVGAAEEGFFKSVADTSSSALKNYSEALTQARELSSYRNVFTTPSNNLTRQIENLQSTYRAGLNAEGRMGAILEEASVRAGPPVRELLESSPIAYPRTSAPAVSVSEFARARARVSATDIEVVPTRISEPAAPPSNNGEVLSGGAGSDIISGGINDVMPTVPSAPASNPVTVPGRVSESLLGRLAQTGIGQSVRAALVGAGLTLSPINLPPISLGGIDIPIASSPLQAGKFETPINRIGISAELAKQRYGNPQKTIATTYGYPGDPYNPAGALTSSGAPVSQKLYSAAHRELPLGSVVKVTNVGDGTGKGKSIAVIINNRGELRTQSQIDLTPGASRAIADDSTDPIAGISTPVEYEVLFIPSQKVASNYLNNADERAAFPELGGLTPEQSQAILGNALTVQKLAVATDGGGIFPNPTAPSEPRVQLAVNKVDTSQGPEPVTTQVEISTTEVGNVPPVSVTISTQPAIFEVAADLTFLPERITGRFIEGRIPADVIGESAASGVFKPTDILSMSTNSAIDTLKQVSTIPESIRGAVAEVQSLSSGVRLLDSKGRALGDVVPITKNAPATEAEANLLASKVQEIITEGLRLPFVILDPVNPIVEIVVWPQATLAVQNKLEAAGLPSLSPVYTRHYAFERYPNKDGSINFNARHKAAWKTILDNSVELADGSGRRVFKDDTQLPKLMTTIKDAEGGSKRLHPNQNYLDKNNLQVQVLGAAYRGEKDIGYILATTEYGHSTHGNGTDTDFAIGPTGLAKDYIWRSANVNNRIGGNALAAQYASFLMAQKMLNQSASNWAGFYPSASGHIGSGKSSNTAWDLLGGNKFKNSVLDPVSAMLGLGKSKPRNNLRAVEDYFEGKGNRISFDVFSKFRDSSIYARAKDGELQYAFKSADKKTTQLFALGPSGETLPPISEVALDVPEAPFKMDIALLRPFQYFSRDPGVSVEVAFPQVQIPLNTSPYAVAIEPPAPAPTLPANVSIPENPALLNAGAADVIIPVQHKTLVVYIAGGPSKSTIDAWRGANVGAAHIDPAQMSRGALESLAGGVDEVILYFNGGALQPGETLNAAGRGVKTYQLSGYPEERVIAIDKTGREYQLERMRQNLETLKKDGKLEYGDAITFDNFFACITQSNCLQGSGFIRAQDAAESTVAHFEDIAKLADEYGLKIELKNPHMVQEIFSPEQFARMFDATDIVIAESPLSFKLTSGAPEAKLYASLPVNKELYVIEFAGDPVKHAAALESLGVKGASVTVADRDYKIPEQPSVAFSAPASQQNPVPVQIAEAPPSVAADQSVSRAPTLVSEPTPTTPPSKVEVATNERVPGKTYVLTLWVETPIAIRNGFENILTAVQDGLRSASERVRVAFDSSNPAGKTGRPDFENFPLGNAVSLAPDEVRTAENVIPVAREIRPTVPELRGTPPTAIVRAEQLAIGKVTVSNSLGNTLPPSPFSVSVRYPASQEIAALDSVNPIQVAEGDIAMLEKGNVTDVAVAETVTDPALKKAVTNATAALTAAQSKMTTAFNSLKKGEAAMKHAERVGNLDGLALAIPASRNIEAAADRLARAAEELAQNPFVSAADRTMLVQNAKTAREQGNAVKNRVLAFKELNIFSQGYNLTSFKEGVTANGESLRAAATQIESTTKRAGKPAIARAANDQPIEVSQIQGVGEVVRPVDTPAEIAVNTLPDREPAPIAVSVAVAKGPFDILPINRRIAAPTAPKSPTEVPTPTQPLTQDPGILNRKPEIRDQNIPPELPDTVFVGRGELGVFTPETPVAAPSYIERLTAALRGETPPAPESSISINPEGPSVPGNGLDLPIGDGPMASADTNPTLLARSRQRIADWWAQNVTFSRQVRELQRSGQQVDTVTVPPNDSLSRQLDTWTRSEAAREFQAAELTRMRTEAEAIVAKEFGQRMDILRKTLAENGSAAEIAPARETTVVESLAQQNQVVSKLEEAEGAIALNTAAGDTQSRALVVEASDAARIAEARQVQTDEVRSLATIANERAVADTPGKDAYVSAAKNLEAADTAWSKNTAATDAEAKAAAARAAEDFKAAAELERTTPLAIPIALAPIEQTDIIGRIDAWQKGGGSGAVPPGGSGGGSGGGASGASAPSEGGIWSKTKSAISACWQWKKTCFLVAGVVGVGTYGVVDNATQENATTDERPKPVVPTNTKILRGGVVVEVPAGTKDPKTVAAETETESTPDDSTSGGAGTKDDPSAEKKDGASETHDGSKESGGSRTPPPGTVDTGGGRNGSDSIFGRGGVGSGSGGFLGGGMSLLGSLFQSFIGLFGGVSEEGSTPQTPTPSKPTPTPQAPVGAIVANPSVIDVGTTTKLSWSSVGTDVSSSTCAVITADFKVYARGGQNGTINSPILTESTRFGIVCNVSNAKNKLLNETLVRVQGDETDPPRIFGPEQVKAILNSASGASSPSGAKSSDGSGSGGQSGNPAPEDVRTCDPEQSMDGFIRCLCDAEPNPAGCSIPPGGLR